MKTIKGATFNTGRGWTQQRTPAARLALFRNLAESYTSKDWRTARAYMHAPDTSALSQGFNTENPGTPYERRRPVWTTFCGTQFRDEEFADKWDDVRIDHSGWFSDADCSRTVRGVVARLTHGRYLAGYYSSDNGERVYLAGVYDDVRTAADAADNEARRIAEDEREYSERWDAAHELDRDIKECAVEVARLFAIRNHRTLGEDAREALAHAVEKLREMRERRNAEFSDIESLDE
jgi:hypothetical protein